MRQLQRLGYAAHYAKTGQEALQMMQQFHYRAVLMDVMMPVIDGCTATITIRTFEREMNRLATPIIAITAYHDRNKCIEAGMNDYLFKPVLLDDLDHALRKWIPPEPGNSC